MALLLARANSDTRRVRPGFGSRTICHLKNPVPGARFFSMQGLPHRGADNFTDGTLLRLRLCFNAGIVCFGEADGAPLAHCESV